MPDNQNKDSDRSSLADLYPQAKTLEERIYDKQLKAQQQMERRPKNIAFMTILQLLGLVVGLVVAGYLSALSLSVSIITGVSFSLFFAVMWLSYAYWVYAGIGRRFALLGYSATPFLMSYTMVYPASVYGLSLFIDPQQQPVNFGIGAIVLHLIVTTILMRLVGARS